MLKFWKMKLYRTISEFLVRVGVKLFGEISKLIFEAAFPLIGANFLSNVPNCFKYILKLSNFSYLKYRTSY